MDCMDGGLDTPENIMTTRAPAVLRIISGGLRTLYLSGSQFLSNKNYNEPTLL